MLSFPLANGSYSEFGEVHDCRISSDEGVCWLSATETAKRDSIAGVRIVTSCLSLLGTLSIICSAIARRKVCSPKVHPIFLLSVADCLLAGFWVAGGIMWLVHLSSHWRIACLAISSATVALECVSINLTLVYALFALAHLKANRLPSALFYPYQTPTAACHPIKTTLTYLLAWFLPVSLVLVLSLGLVGTSHTMESVSVCSCWCMPGFANVLPMAPLIDSATVEYNRSLKRLVLGFACVVFVQYLLVFPLLLVTYHCTLNLIKTIRPSNKESRLSRYYGATEVVYIRGQSEAKQRVLIYLLTFIILGFSNCLLSFIVIVHQSVEGLSPESSNSLPMSGSHSLSSTTSNSLSNTLLAVFLLQSVTVPLQGFLNAIVYGWTRGDFLQVLAISTSLSSHQHSHTFEEEEEERGREGGGGTHRDKMERDTPELLSGTYE